MALFRWSFAARPQPLLVTVNKAPAMSTIPSILHRTSNMPAASKMPHLLGSYASGFDVRFYDDAECATFIRTHFDSRIIAAYMRLTDGAHRADLFRYCVLYIVGGVYLDIKSILRRPLSEIFPTIGVPSSKFTWYTSLCSSHRCIYNGVIASPPGNPFLLALIEHMANTTHAPPDRHYYVRHMLHLLQHNYGRLGGAARYETAGTRLELLEERCSRRWRLDDAECRVFNTKVLDRHGFCCNLYGARASDSRLRGLSLGLLTPMSAVLTTRDPTYPWLEAEPSRSSQASLEGAVVRRGSSKLA